jgi:hypothetical protein
MDGGEVSREAVNGLYGVAGDIAISLRHLNVKCDNFIAMTFIIYTELNINGKLFK